MKLNALKMGMLVLTLVLCTAIGCGKKEAPEETEVTEAETTEAETEKIVHVDIIKDPELSVSDEEIKKNTLTIGDGYLYSPDPALAVKDEETGIRYYNNMLKIFLRKEVTDEEAAEIASSVGGKVVGYVRGSLNILQVLVPDTDLDGLKSLAASLEENENIYYADVATYVPSGSSDYWDGDPDQGNEASPSGGDWWAESIRAYSAWTLAEGRERGTVVSGVVDSGFDRDHEDLNENGSPVITLISDEDSIDDHGTHVAGLIGAQKNEVGMRGVCSDTVLICADSMDASGEMDVEEIILLAWYNEMIADAEKQNAPCVINNSFGAVVDRAMTINSYRSLRNRSRSGGRIIASLINAGHDRFILVQAAGNGYAVIKGNEYYDEGIGYDIANGLGDLFCGFTREIYDDAVSERSDYFFGVSYEEIMEHIVVVAATSELAYAGGVYQLTEFSNYGDTVTISAPGLQIYSTVPDDQYEYMHGTSMAAPIVTGSLSLMWSLNPELSSAQIKDAMVSTAFSVVGVTEEDAGRVYPELDLYAAVEKVLTLEPEEKELVDVAYVYSESDPSNKDEIYFDESGNVTEIKYSLKDSNDTAMASYYFTLSKQAEMAFMGADEAIPRAFATGTAGEYRMTVSYGNGRVVRCSNLRLGSMDGKQYDYTYNGKGRIYELTISEMVGGTAASSETLDYIYTPEGVWSGGSYSVEDEGRTIIYAAENYKKVYEFDDNGLWMTTTTFDDRDASVGTRTVTRRSYDDRGGLSELRCDVYSGEAGSGSYDTVEAEDELQLSYVRDDEGRITRIEAPYINSSFVVEYDRVEH